MKKIHHSTIRNNLPLSRFTLISPYPLRLFYGCSPVV